jgi:hypothetical protein
LQALLDWGADSTIRTKPARGEAGNRLPEDIARSEEIKQLLRTARIEAEKEMVDDMVCMNMIYILCVCVCVCV